MFKFFEVWHPSWYQNWYYIAAAYSFYLLIALHVYVKSELYTTAKIIVVDIAKEFASGDAFYFIRLVVVGAAFMAVLLVFNLVYALFWPVSILYMSSRTFGRWRAARKAQ